MLKSIREEPIVTETLSRAERVYPRVWDAYDALCWLLAHRIFHGASIQGASDIYFLHKQAAGGWAVPKLTVIYTMSADMLVFRAIKVG